MMFPSSSRVVDFQIDLQQSDICLRPDLEHGPLVGDAGADTAEGERPHPIVDIDERKPRAVWGHFSIVSIVRCLEALYRSSGPSAGDPH